MARHFADEQRERIREHFPEENILDGCPERNSIHTPQVLDGVPWILNTGDQRCMLPPCYPSAKTFHCRFHQWFRKEVPREVLCRPASTLRVSGALPEQTVVRKE